MADFADILSEAMTRRDAEAAQDRRWRRATRNIPLIEAAAGPGAPGGFVHESFDEARSTSTRPTLEGVLREIEHARRSRAGLRTLRRRLARALHPDRHGDAADADLLGRCNALIDAALKEASP
ncbi:MAG: hypothetical protein U1E28_11345 [Beijerinckiaceae bacterium]